MHVTISCSTQSRRPARWRSTDDDEAAGTQAAVYGLIEDVFGCALGRHEEELLVQLIKTIVCLATSCMFMIVE